MAFRHCQKHSILLNVKNSDPVLRSRGLSGMFEKGLFIISLAKLRNALQCVEKGSFEIPSDQINLKFGILMPLTDQQLLFEKSSLY